MDLEKGFAKLDSVPWPSRNPQTLPTRLQEHCTSCATGPATEAEYVERARGSRRLAYTLLIAAFAAYIAWMVLR